MQKRKFKKKTFNIVFDIGKLNAKILIFDKYLKIKKIIKTNYPNIKIKNNFFIKDINFLISWLKKNLFLSSKKFEIDKTRKALSTLRLHLAEELGLRNPEVFAPLWVLDFPLLEWDEDTERYRAMHHPFTSPKPNDIAKLDTNPAAVRANAYDLVLNGNEIGGGESMIEIYKN